MSLAENFAPTWDTSVPDWEQRIVNRQPLIPSGLPIYKPRASQALRCFKRLRLVDVVGMPKMEDACAPWVFDFVYTIFGAFDPIGKRQIIKDFFLLIAKKNGKSSIAAGIMLTALLLNQRRNGEYLILAPTKDVADNSFGPIKGMIDAEPSLAERYKVNAITREITNRLDGAVLAVKAADADVVGGQKAISVLIDELWLFGKKAGAENILAEATGSLVSRPEGFVISLSTHSDQPPAGVFKKTLQYMRSVRSGEIIDPTSLAVIYEWPEEMLRNETWRDPAWWFVTNPNMGRSVDADWLRSRYAKKEAEGQDSLRLFVAKHLNVEIGLALRSDRWAGAKFWEKRADPQLTLSAVLDRSEVVVVGIDGGGLDDLFGLAVLGREKDPVKAEVEIEGEIVTRMIKRWLLWSHAWCHRGVLEERKTISSALTDFAEARELTIVSDELGDLSTIVGHIKAIQDRGLLGEVAVDPAGLGELVDELAAIDVSQENGILQGVTQGWAMMNAIKTAERRLANGTLIHGGLAMMNWCVGNLKIEPTATGIRATKQNAGDAKIDPIMAAFNAVERMSRNPVSNHREYQLFVV